MFFSSWYSLRYLRNNENTMADEYASDSVPLHYNMILSLYHPQYTFVSETFQLNVLFEKRDSNCHDNDIKSEDYTETESLSRSICLLTRSGKASSARNKARAFKTHGTHKHINLLTEEFDSLSLIKRQGLNSHPFC